MGKKFNELKDNSHSYTDLRKYFNNNNIHCFHSYLVSSISFQQWQFFNWYIRSLDGSLTSNNTQGQGGPGSNCNEEIFHTS